MAKQEPGQFLVDGIGALDAGMNVGLVPQLLPPNQTSLAVNMTFRGGYGTHRPPLREIFMNFPTDYPVDNFIRQPFQGACFYQPDSGAQSIIAAIGGRLFQISPSGTTANVLDISVTGDFNPSTPQQAWLWQCERFIIVNDGVSLPIFFDGNFSRRSNGINKVLATLSGAFTIPAVGATVTATVTAPYTGPINISVLINGAQFTLTRASGNINPDAHLQYLFGPLKTDGHFLVDGNVPIISYPNRLGSTLRDIPAGTVDITGTTHNGIRVFTTELYDANANPILPPGNSSGLNIQIQIGNEAFIITGATRAFNPNTGSFTGNPTLIMTLVKTFPTQKATTTDHPSGSIITVVSSQPTVTLGVTGGPFVVHDTNDIFTAPIWTYPKQIVWIEDTQFIITPIPNPITNTITLVNVTGTPGGSGSGNISAMPELPPGRMGVYGMGRNWMALTDGTGFIASDIVGGSSGTAVYNLRDAPLRVTENALLAGGGAFRVPGAVGDIRAMRFSATLDVSLGQGPLQVFTTMAAFSCNAPVDRTTWSTVVNPILTQSLIGAGALSQSSTALANGDIIFRAVDGIRSLILARREFDTWGNVPQSREVESILALDDPTLTQFESAAVVENRLLMTCLPSNGPLGIFCQGIISLNFDPISTLRGKAPSIYDGLWTGMNVLQLVQGVFNGVERCYALCFDGVLSRIRLFEIEKTSDNPFDNNVTPVTYSFESASLFTNNKIKNTYDLIELMDGEMYLSDIRGVVNIEVWYRPNYSDCWTKWTEFGICGDNTDTSKPVQYRSPIGLGSPSVEDCDPNTDRPARIGLTFQVRFQITGSCKFRGARFRATAVPDTKFSVAQCKPLCVTLADSKSTDCEPCKTQNNCLQFPLVLYNLNANKSYSNEPTTVNVKCPDGSTQAVPVPSNTINYTLPFAPGFTGDYPPLVMNCLSGGVIVKTIPSGATQDQIDLIVNEMISECVVAYAQSIAQCGGDSMVFPSEQVTTTHTCDEGQTLQYTGTLPSWISIDEDTGVITGNAGVVTSTISVADATSKAQSQLDAWVNQQLGNGNLHCGSAGPVCIAPIGNLPIPFSGLTGEASGTKDASTRRIVILSPTDGVVVFVNTQTNSIIGSTTLSGLTNISRGDFAGFATSTKRFYVTVAAGVHVLDPDGNFITTVAFPVNTTGAVSCIYSPTQDRIYTIAFNNDTSSRHIIVINPHTNAVVNDVDTGFADYVYIYYASGIDQMLIQHDAFSLETWNLNTVTHANTLSFSSRFEMDYAPNVGKWFVPAVQFSPTYQLTVIDGASLTVLGTIDLPTFTGVTQYVKYNPTSQTIVAFSFNGEIAVIDPVTLTVICELADADEFDGAICVDYSSGDDYLLDWNGADNPLLIYH